MNKNEAFYYNSLENKWNIFKENKNKIGVYRWVNIITNESYVGGSVNISKRLRKYYCENYLKDRLSVYNSRIYKALLEYGYFNFSLEILEYCDKDYLIKREQFYIDKIQPEYNISKTAGSMLGFKHSLITLSKFKNRNSISSQNTIGLDMETRNIIA